MYVRDEIERLSQRYADRMEEVKTIHRLKRKLSQDLCI